jgi:hypothetical protein
MVHALVAEAFICPRPKGMEVNHKDGVKTNNHFSNLEWLTRRGNAEHARDMGLLATGERHPRHTKPEAWANTIWPTSFPALQGERNYCHKLTAEKVREMRRIREEQGLSAAKLGVMFNISESVAYRVIRGQKWQSAL